MTTVGTARTASPVGAASTESTVAALPASGLAVERLGVVLAPDPAEPYEHLGILNPAAARDGDGDLYLFPRIVAAGNYSRIARVRVGANGNGAPGEVARLGVVLEPGPSWERHGHGGGVEDPRITRIDDLNCWVMTYTAYGPLGPKIALAVSDDLRRWTRLGPVSFRYETDLEADFNLYPNKDAAFFPEPVTAPDGSAAFAMVHRPTYDLWSVTPGAGTVLPAGVRDDRGSIWVSFVGVEQVLAHPAALTRLGQHRLIAGPEQPWERVKIGTGPAPVRVDAGWLLVYHGVSGSLSYDWPQPDVRYSAGVMVLDPDDVTQVRWRTQAPILEPETDGECNGLIPQVVFPTAMERRDDETFDVYYGMADDKVGMMRMRGSLLR